MRKNTLTCTETAYIYKLALYTCEDLIIITDHYDSYTNNVLQLLRGTSKNGDANDFPLWEALIIRFDRYSWDDFKSNVLPYFHAVILSPGPGRPDREADFGFNARLIKEAKIPILGICLGHQGIGTSLGAKIVHAPNIKHGQVSQIKHDGSGVLEGLPPGFDAVRYNSLVLQEESLPDDLIATAWTYDAEDPASRVLMGVRHRAKPIYGVQWHPESVCSSHGKEIVSNFRKLVREFHRSSDQRPNPRYIALPGSLLQDSAMATTFQTPRLEKETSVRHERLAYRVKVTELGAGPPPETVFSTFIRNSTHDGDAWLDSAKLIDSRSRHSYLAAGAFSISYCTHSKRVSIYQHGKIVQCENVEDSYWSWLANLQSKIQAWVRPVDVDADFQVGFMGYFGYELKRESLDGYHYTPNDADAKAQPDGQLLFANTVLCFDHWSDTWRVYGLIRVADTDPIAQEIGASDSVGLSEAEFDAYTADMRTRFSNRQSWRASIAAPIPAFLSHDNQKSYSKSIEEVRDAIREGESYEMTLTTTFRAGLGERDPFDIYLSLRQRNPAPYSAYMDFPTYNTSILSSSPERFISIDRHGFAEMKPIKGTVAVSPDPVEDARRKQRLATDVKELAENLMIVDLIRSDLHNVSPTSSIMVPKLLHVETYTTVHQLVTTIHSRLRPNLSPITALKSVFPPGSMTGAPKLRSVQLLEKIENDAPRGAYAGSLGYLCVSGSADQSVVIRTIVRRGEELVLGAGGAITWLSDCKKEWEEVLVKARAVAGVVDGKAEREDSLDPKVLANGC